MSAREELRHLLDLLDEEGATEALVYLRSVLDGDAPSRATAAVRLQARLAASPPPFPPPLCPHPSLRRKRVRVREGAWIASSAYTLPRFGGLQPAVARRASKGGPLFAMTRLRRQGLAHQPHFTKNTGV